MYCVCVSCTYQEVRGESPWSDLLPALSKEASRASEDTYLLTWYCNEFMEWLTDPLRRKVTVSTVNYKLKELRQLPGIYTYVHHPCRFADLPTLKVCHASSLGNMLSCTPFLLLAVELNSERSFPPYRCDRPGAYKSRCLLLLAMEQCVQMELSCLIFQALRAQ